MALSLSQIVYSSAILGRFTQYLYPYPLKIFFPSDFTVAPLLSLIQEMSTSPNDITIEMQIHDGTEVYVTSYYYPCSALPPFHHAYAFLLLCHWGEVLTSWTGKVSHITILVGKHDKKDYSRNTLLKTASQ